MQKLGDRQASVLAELPHSSPCCRTARCVAREDYEASPLFVGPEVGSSLRDSTQHRGGASCVGLFLCACVCRLCFQERTVGSKTLCEKVRVLMVVWEEGPCGQGEASLGNVPIPGCTFE